MELNFSADNHKIIAHFLLSRKIFSIFLIVLTVCFSGIWSELPEVPSKSTTTTADASQEEESKIKQSSSNSTRGANNLNEDSLEIVLRYDQVQTKYIF